MKKTNYILIIALLCALILTVPASAADEPVAGFTADVTSGTAPFTVNFTDQSTGAASWSWDFDGDGIEDSAEQNPQHVFYPGNYTVNLTVSNTIGSDNVIKDDYIWVIGPYSTALGNENPGAPDPGIPKYIGPGGDGKYDVVDYPDNYKNPIFVGSYTSIVDYSPTTMEGAGTLSLGDLNQSQIDAGMSPGEITVWFEAPICNGDGADFVAYENGFISGNTNRVFAELGYVEVSTDGVNFVRFPSVSYTPGRVGDYGAIDARNVYNLIGKHVNMYGDYWGTPFDLDDLVGDPAVLNGSVDLNDINYVKVIDIPGSGDFKDSLGNPIYDAWVTWGTGGLEFYGVDVIHCRSSYRPIAGFTADVTSGAVPLTVNFTDTSERAESWAWDFGDGNTSSEQNPVHIYTAAGTYSVNLTVANVNGSVSEVKSDYIVVSTDSGYAYSGGSGTGADPYRISTGGDLVALTTDTGNWGKYFILTDDISLSSVAMSDSIGINETISFNGNFDGRDHTISGFTMNKSESDYVGLFGYIGSGAEIKDLRVEAVGEGVVGNKYVSVLAGYNTGTITNCSTTGNVTAVNSFSGGLVGYNKGTITNCSTTGNVNANEGYAGGLVGYNNRCIITNSYATGTVTSTDYAGGLVGHDTRGTITNCYATGSVTTSGYLNSGTGGLVGRSYIDTIMNCYATGNATSGSYYAGGLVGSNYKGTITNCYATGSATAIRAGAGGAGGLVGDSSGIIEECHATGNAITSNWAGGLVGSSSGIITDSSATGNAISYGSYSGGLAGINSGTITNCYATGNATADDNAGGLVGKHNGGFITNSSATGSASATGDYAGGLVGFNDDNDNEDTITNSYATGSATASNLAGGLAGYSRGVITNCYATGNATATGDYAGGFVGRNNGIIENAYATGMAVANNSAGGLLGSNSDFFGNNGTVTNCYRYTGGESDLGTLISDITTFRDYAFLTGTETGNGLNWSTGIISIEEDASKIWKAFSDRSSYPVFQWQLVSGGPGESPTANFTADVTSGTAPFTVNFTDRSTGAVSWSWDFDGDGIADSAEQNPQHIFYPGNYTVNLTVSNSAGSDTESKDDYIGVIGPYSTALGNENPGAPDSGIPKYIGPDGDGVYDTSSDDNNNYLNPVFVASYTSIVDYSPAPGVSEDYLSLGDLNQSQIDAGVSPGEITVWFEAPICNGEGADFATFENGFIELGTDDLIFAELGYVEVSTDGEHFVRFPSVSYTPERVGGYGGVDARNVYNLFGKHVAYYGDYWGTPFDLDALVDEPGVLNGSVDLNNINYIKVIDIPGSGDFKDSLGNPIYDAWVTWGTGGLDFFDLRVINCVPVANFTADETTGSGSLTVQFNDTSSGAPTSWLWDFGDGNTSTEQNPVHEYTTNGTYTVSLKATNEFGNDLEVKTGYITVEYKDPRSPDVDFTADPTYGAFPLSVQFTDTSTNDPTGWLWDFGDGNTSTKQNPVHEYASIGVYTVKLTATNEFGPSYKVETDYIWSNAVLADSPWPKFRMDAKNSGISPYTGPQINNTVWNITTDASFGTSSSFSIGSDGTIYFGGGSSDYNVYAMNPDGTLKWNYTVGKAVYSTAISSDGTIYFGCTDKNCYALNPNGTLKWSYPTASVLVAPPAIGSDGTIYFGGQSGQATDGTVYALNPEGTLKWSYTDEDNVVSSVCPAIGSDGIIYVPFRDGTLYALDSDGTVKWNFSTGGQIYSSPVLDSNDVLYVGNTAAQLVVINSDGTEKWNYTVTDRNVVKRGGFQYSSPIVGTDGTVYIGARAKGGIYALNSDGTLKWNNITSGRFIGSPVIGADGTIYIGGSSEKKIYAINPDGTFKWTYKVESNVESPPAISSDGTLYIGTTGGILYAFRDPAEPPVAGFTVDITSGDVPLPVSFTDTSERAETRAWDFDSDGVVDSTKQNPTYNYISPGTYTVTLTVSNTGGSDTVVMEDCITVLDVTASPSSDNTWYQFGKTVQHTGYTDSDAPDTNTLLWRSSRLTDDFTLVPSSSVAVADGKVFANAIIGPVDGDGNPKEGAIGQLVAFSMYNGRVYWNTTISVPELGSWSSPVYDNGYVFTSTGPDTTCINATTGAIEWTFTNPSGRASCNGGPVIAEGKVLCSDWDGLHYYCLDEANGSKLWEYTVNSRGSYTQGTPAIRDGTIILTSWADIYCLDMDGNLQWEKPNPSSGDICGSPSIAGDLFYLTTYDFGSDDNPALFAFYLKNGTQVWNATIQRSDSTPAIADGYLYVSGGCTGYSESQTYCFDALNGTLIWNTTKSAEGIGDWTSSIAVADGKAFVGKSAGASFGHAGLYALNAATGAEIWHSEYAGDSPAIAGDTVFSIGMENKVCYLYAFKDNESAAPVADFSADVTSGEAPLTVQFSDLSAGAESWAWDFDDDGVVDSTNQSPQYIYAEAGVYNVSLTVSNSAGDDTETKTGYITCIRTLPVLSFGPESASVIESQTTEINITVSSLPDGLAGYNLTVTLDDPDVAEIVGISYPSWVNITENSFLPGSSVYMAALDGNDVIQAEAEDVVLATLTVSGKDVGLANLSISVHRMDDDAGYRIEPELATGEVEVTLFTLPGEENSPRDLDGDGLYEDLTGNGEFSFVDIVAYFHNIDWIDENLPTEFFDFNGNGRIDFDDIVDMFGMLE